MSDGDVPIIMFFGRDSRPEEEVWLTLRDDGTWTAPPGGLEKVLAVYDAGAGVLGGTFRFTVPPDENVVYETTKLRDPWAESN